MHYFYYIGASNLKLILDPQEINIINGIKNGDTHYFEMMYNLYARQLLQYANSILADIDNSKDIIHDVFVKIWEKRTQLNINSSLKAYLYTSVRNASFDYIRHQQSNKNFIDKVREELYGIEDEYFQSVFDQSEQSITESRIQKIAEAINGLPTQCGKIFKMSRYQGMKNKDIAIELKLSVRSVDTQIYRALKYLRRTTGGNNK